MAHLLLVMGEWCGWGVKVSWWESPHCWKIMGNTIITTTLLGPWFCKPSSLYNDFQMRA